MGTKTAKPVQKAKKLGNVETLQAAKPLKSGAGLKKISPLRRGPSIGV